jgi:hypothetical protein
MLRYNVVIKICPLPDSDRSMGRQSNLRKEISGYFHQAHHPALEFLCFPFSSHFDYFSLVVWVGEKDGRCQFAFPKGK